MDRTSERLVLAPFETEIPDERIRPHRRAPSASIRRTVGGKHSTVGAARVDSSTLSDEALQRCVVSQVQRWRFPAPRGGGIAIVRYPFRFAGPEPSALVPQSAG